MNFRTVIHAVSLLVLMLSIAMLSAVPVSYFCGDETAQFLPLLLCSLFCIAISGTGVAVTRTGHDMEFGFREGFLAVGAAWIVMVLFGALPFFLCGNFTVYDALFESASGLSTTGATIVEKGMPLRGGAVLQAGIEGLSRGLLYWRSMLNWLGGVGVVMLVLLVLPGRSSSQMLYNAEVPGVKTASDQVTPRMVSSIRIIAVVYLLLTVATVFLYGVGGMNTFDSVCHAFSTVSTGGFSTKSTSMANMSPMIQWTAIAVMFLSSCNFILVVRFLVQHRLAFLSDEEFRFFLTIILVAGIAAGLMLFQSNGPIPSAAEPSAVLQKLEQSFRNSFFTVISLISTTGYTVTDYCQWHMPGAVMILLVVSLCGGCGGSTSGGMKCVRILLVLKQAASELRHCIFPHALTDIRLNGIRLESTVIQKTLGFMTLYLMILLLTAGLLPFLCEKPVDPLTALSASLSCIGNIGPGFGKVGPAFSYQWMGNGAKVLLSLAMIAGRLELYTIIVLFLPSFWKR